MSNDSSRNLFLYQEVDSSIVKDLTTQILAFNEEDKADRDSKKNFKEKPINLYINSYGGYVDAAFALINIIESSQTPINTICTGVAASAAFLIFLSGSNRKAYKESRMMYHQLQQNQGIVYQDLKFYEETLETVKLLQQRCVKYILKKTAIPEEILKDKYERKLEWWVDSEDYSKYEIAEVINWTKS